MKVFTKCLEIILNIVIVIIVLIMLLLGTYVFQINVLKYEYANIIGYTGFEVITGSMSGTIEVSDFVIAKIQKDVNINDIIVYKDGNAFITHRLIKIENDNLTTKGDANNAEDSNIKLDQVIGKVVKVIPKVGIWKKVLSTPSVAISIIVVIVLFGLAFSYETKKGNKLEIKEKSDDK